VLYCACLGTPWKRGAPACTLAIHGLEQLMGLFCKSIGPASNGHRSWCLWSRSESCCIASAGRFRDRDKPPSFMRGFMTSINLLVYTSHHYSARKTYISKLRNIIKLLTIIYKLPLRFTFSLIGD